MTEHGFLEITTPILTASSPEGARDYLVPARKHPGKFYALPQAPQQFKQLLMTSGFDRYFQIAPCFRDEDARADRSPGEFYQLDMEMAFATQEDVFAVLEDVLPPIFAKYGTYDRRLRRPLPPHPLSTRPWRRYGSDKPDLRIDLTVQDVTELLCRLRLRPLRGQHWSRPWWSPTSPQTRKQIDKLCADVEVPVRQQGLLVPAGRKRRAGGRHRQVRPAHARSRSVAALGLKPSTLRGVWPPGKLPPPRRPPACCVKTAGRRSARTTWTRSSYEFCWIVDFPMYEIGEEIRRAGVLPQPLLHAQRRPGGAAEGRAGRDRIP